MRKPLTGALLGIVLGLAIAVVLQQAGVWPLDQITVFLMPALTGLLGLVMLSVGREGSTVTLVIALLLLIPMAVWGALGLGSINENGELNGGCEVAAQSKVDITNIVDTSRGDPFEIDPQGGLAWIARSPVPFVDYDWSLYAEIGGIQVTLDSGHETNEGMSDINGGDVPDIEAYAAEHGVDISQLRGVFIVGGEAADTCDGFAFVLLTTSNPFETIASKVALVVILLIVIILVILMLSGKGKAVVQSSTATVVADGVEGMGPGEETVPETPEGGNPAPPADE